jgi:hypothetical protein
VGKERDYPTLKDREVVATNYPTTGERLAALRAARGEAADIALTVASVAEVQTRLEQIRAALPAVEMELTK